MKRSIRAQELLLCSPKYNSVILTRSLAYWWQIFSKRLRYDYMWHWSWKETHTCTPLMDHSHGNMRTQSEAIEDDKQCCTYAKRVHRPGREMYAVYIILWASVLQRRNVMHAYRAHCRFCWVPSRLPYCPDKGSGSSMSKGRSSLDFLPAAALLSWTEFRR